jgi:ABC-type polysaccharide/polyol phosphate transport system ATPase subunit
MTATRDAALEVIGVHKKFRKGEIYDSLRDLIPVLTGRLLGGRRAAPEARDFWALDDVSFTVGRGEAFGIVGQNGAGKSTMLKLLTGIMRPTTGRILVHGRLSALIEVSAGFHPDLTGRENIYLNGTIFGMSRAEIRRKFDQIVEFSGLAEFIDTPVKRYSSGMFARLGFSVAAHVDPDILIVDEVLSVGDYLFQQKCVQRMESVIRSGTTVIFVSHNLRAVSSLCRRSLLLERGRVVEIGETNRVLTTYLSRGRPARDDRAGRAVSLTNVHVGSPAGARLDFTSGDTLRVEVEVEARERCHDLAVVIQIVDENQYSVFDTCTQRLGQGPQRLEPGQRLRCAFDLDLQLAGGAYRVNAYAHRYVTNQAYDQWYSAATFFVGDVPAIRGAANLHPVITSCVIGDGEPQVRPLETVR